MKQRQQNGFTLIELMVTVAIVGILASIAYPAYQDSVTKSRRRDVEGVLLDLSNVMERYYTVNNTYVGAPTPLSSNYYTVTISAADATSYTLSAAPISTSAQAHDKCGTLKYDSTGKKDITGQATGIAVPDCW